MRPTLLLTLLLAPAAVLAQSPMPNSALANSVAALRHRMNSCPVGFTVSKQPQGAVLLASKPALYANNSAPSSLSFELRFGPARIAKTSSLPEDQIVHATVVLHGFTGARVVPVADSVATETETTELNNDGHPLTVSDFRTTKLTAVSWVELTHADFADGHAWESTTPSHCTAVPNNLVLVK